MSNRAGDCLPQRPTEPAERRRLSHRQTVFRVMYGIIPAIVRPGYGSQFSVRSLRSPDSLEAGRGVPLGQGVSLGQRTGAGHPGANRAPSDPTLSDGAAPCRPCSLPSVITAGRSALGRRVSLSGGAGRASSPCRRQCAGAARALRRWRRARPTHALPARSCASRRPQPRCVRGARSLRSHGASRGGGASRSPPRESSPPQGAPPRRQIKTLRPATNREILGRMYAAVKQPF